MQPKTHDPIFLPLAQEIRSRQQTDDNIRMLTAGLQCQPRIIKLRYYGATYEISGCGADCLRWEGSDLQPAEEAVSGEGSMNDIGVGLCEVE